MAATTGPRRPLARILLVAALVVGWALAVPFMWQAVTTLPSAERLRTMSSQIMHVPGPGTLLRTAGQSLAELLLLVLLLWPGWRRFWLPRLLLAFLALGIWAVITMPLELTRLEQVHHQWLVGSDVALLFAIFATLGTRVWQAIRRARAGTAT